VSLMRFINISIEMNSLTFIQTPSISMYVCRLNGINSQ
jgi:hypothetical protein